MAPLWKRMVARHPRLCRLTATLAHAAGGERGRRSRRSALGASGPWATTAPSARPGGSDARGAGIPRGARRPPTASARREMLR